MIATNLGIDKRLLEEALKIGKHKSEKDTVNEALKEYVMRRKRRDILSLFGEVEMESSYDYRKERNARLESWSIPSPGPSPMSLLSPSITTTSCQDQT